MKTIFTLLMLAAAFCMPAVTNAQFGPDPEAVFIDRFSMAAGHLFVRTEENGLPGPNEPIDFEQPFRFRKLCRPGPKTV